MLKTAERSVPQWPTAQDLYNLMQKMTVRYMPCSPQRCFGLFHIVLLKFCEEYYSEGFLKTSLLTGSCQR